MFLSDVAIRRPVLVTMLSLALVVFGLLGYRQLPVDQFPPVEFPILLVKTVYPGASPTDVERDVTEPIEEAVASTPGIDMLRSITRDSVSIVVVRFELGTELAGATATIRDRVGSVQGELPSGAELPVIEPIDVGALPVMVAALSAPGGVNEARRLADQRLRSRIEQVDGVGSVDLLGGQDREILVALDLDALRAVEVSPTEVIERLGIENVSLPAGTVASQGFEIGVRTDGQYASVDDIRSTVVAGTPDGRQVRLGEVATVTDGFAPPERLVRIDGKDAVAIEVIKRSGANTVEVVGAVERTLAEVVPTLGSGVRYELIWNNADRVEANAEEVTTAIWFGGAMAILVILFFLLDWRGTLISALALPTSVIGTFAAMAALGFSINTMTLIGLSLAIGLLIDDAVVVREAITHRLDLGDDPFTAARLGTAEVALPVLATTFSLVAVFVPVAFMSGIVGQFFAQFGLTIAAAVLLSTFVALTLDPMLSARLSRRREGPRAGVAGTIEGWLDDLDDRYRGTLDVVLRNPLTTVAVSVAIFVGSLALASRLPTEFIPTEDRGDFFADLKLPVGTALETTDEAARSAEARITALPDVATTYTIVGHEGHDQVARFRIKLASGGERRSQDEVKQDVREVIEAVPSAVAELSDPAVIEGIPDWPPLQVQLQGVDPDGLRREAERLRDMLEGIEGTEDVRLSLTPGRPELSLEIDRAVAADRGLPVGLIAVTLRQLMDGAVVGTLRDGGPKAEIRVRAAERFREDADAIRALPLPSPRGYVGLGDVARVSMGAGPSEIQRLDRMRSVEISSQIGPGGALGTVLGQLRERLAQAPLPEGFLFTLDGQARDMEETTEAIGFAIGVGLLVIFMVLASQFESLFQPFTLMLSIPLAFVGAFLALFLTGSTISMGSQIGLILLMGLVTKNSILLVDGALSYMRDDGLDPEAAIRKAGPRRLRPVLMTSAAMVFGMLPTALNTGIGASFRAPMAVAVIGGVLSSTVLTLLVVPIFFLWIEHLNARAMALLQRISGDPRPPDAEPRPRHPDLGTTGGPHVRTRDPVPTPGPRPGRQPGAVRGVQGSG